MLLALTTIPLACSPKLDNSPPVAPSESNRWLELLKILPENEITLQASYLQDTAYMLEKIAASEYAVGTSLPMFERYGDGDVEWKATLGFVRSDVDQTIYASVGPPRQYEAMRGRFSQADIDNAVKTGPLNGVLETVTYKGHQFYSWGGDFDINLSARSNVRPQGIGGRLALIDNFVLWMRWTDGIKEMIDAYEDNIASLADNEDYQLLAGALGEFDTVTAFFSTGSQSYNQISKTFRQVIENPGDNEGRQALVAEIQREPRLKPYRAFATGAGLDEKGYYLAIVLANPDEATARENAGLLEDRLNQARIVGGRNAGEMWKDKIDEIEIRSSGTLTLAKLYGSSVEYWNDFQPVGPYEPLLLHE
jgi:hypothetical protein